MFDVSTSSIIHNISIVYIYSAYVPYISMYIPYLFISLHHFWVIFGEGAMSGSDVQQLQKLRKRLGLQLDDEARSEFITQVMIR